MRYQIHRDENGNPAYVDKDNGFIMESRKFDPERDGWMEDQLNPMDFPAIRTGRDMEFLVAEVNALRKELFQEKQMNEKWRKAAGF